VPARTMWGGRGYLPGGGGGGGGGRAAAATTASAAAATAGSSSHGGWQVGQVACVISPAHIERRGEK